MHSDSLEASVQAARLTWDRNLCRKNRAFSVEGKRIWASAPCLFSTTNVIQFIPLDSTGPASRKRSRAPLHFCFASFSTFQHNFLLAGFKHRPVFLTPAPAVREHLGQWAPSPWVGFVSSYFTICLTGGSKWEMWLKWLSSFMFSYATRIFADTKARPPSLFLLPQQWDQPYLSLGSPSWKADGCRV